MPYPIAPRVAAMGTGSKPPVMDTDDPATAAAVVSGAGTAAVNGTYTMRGTSGGRNYYNLVGQPDDPIHGGISWSADDLFWSLYGVGEGAVPIYYVCFSDVAYPWLGTWNVNDGDSPAPTVTMGSS